LSNPDLEARDFLETRFGVPPDRLEEVRFLTRRDELWMTSARSEAELVAIRPPGLRALRRTRAGFKPTSTLLRILGRHLQRNIIKLSLDDLSRLLLGRSLPCSATDGFVALAFDDEILGCGRCSGGELRCLLPTGQRKALLEILEGRP
jgi:NOL1/NOP2/fmu family ribosome biogenesis protein